MTDMDEVLAKIRHADHRQIYEYWKSKSSANGLPARRDIDPVDLRRLLPRIALIDVLRDGETLDFRYRLTGTEIVERSGRDPTGKCFTELYQSDYLKTALATYNTIVETAAPQMSQRTYPLVEGREFLRYDRLLLPLAADGRTVDMVLLLIVVLEQRRMDDD